MVMVRPAPNKEAMISPFFPPLPMLRGIIMKTSGSVQGKIIIESPARYEMINHEGYDNSCPELIAVSLVIPKISPTKINEKSTNTVVISDFFATTLLDTY